MVIGLTGHRPERLNGEDLEIMKWIENALDLLVKGRNGSPHLCLWGGAKGADDLFYDIAAEYSNCKIMGVLPWSNYRDDSEFLERRARLDNLFCCLMNASSPTESKLYIPEYVLEQDRDDFIARHCDVLLAVWDGIKEGGTWETIQRAQRYGKFILYYCVGQNC